MISVAYCSIKNSSYAAPAGIAAAGPISLRRVLWYPSLENIHNAMMPAAMTDLAAKVASLPGGYQNETKQNQILCRAKKKSRGLKCPPAFSGNPFHGLKCADSRQEKVSRPSNLLTTQPLESFAKALKLLSGYKLQLLIIRPVEVGYLARSIEASRAQEQCLLDCMLSVSQTALRPLTGLTSWTEYLQGEYVTKANSPKLPEPV